MISILSEMMDEIIDFIVLNAKGMVFSIIGLILLGAVAVLMGMVVYIIDEREEKKKMITEKRIQRDLRRLENVMTPYSKNAGAHIGFISNEEGKNSLLIGGNIRMIVDGVVLILVRLLMTSNMVTEEVFDYVSTTGREMYRKAMGIPVEPPKVATEESAQVENEKETKEEHEGGETNG